MKSLMILSLILISGYGAFAQKSKAKPSKNKPNSAITTNYTCPMHPEVTSDKPGKCPKCGMDLHPSPKEKLIMEGMKIFSCPMHPDVTSSKPGKCTKCYMELKEKKEDYSSQQH